MKRFTKLFLVLALLVSTGFAGDGHTGTGGYTCEGHTGTGGYVCDGHTGTGGLTDGSTSDSKGSSTEPGEEASMMEYMAAFFGEIFG